MTLPERHAAIIAESRSWCGTKYHAQTPTAVKGAGCDCGSLLYSIYFSQGLIPEAEIGIHAPDWFCHLKEDIYLKRLVRLLRVSYEPVKGVTWPSLQAGSGSILLLKCAGSTINNHGGIVTEWPKLVHAVHPEVAEIDASRDPMWACQPVLVFDPFRK